MKSITILKEEYDNWCDFYQIKKGRKDRDVLARYAFFVAASDYYSSPDIGDMAGYDHTTILYALKKHQDNIQYAAGYKLIYDHAVKVIESLRKELDEQDFRYTAARQYTRLRKEVESLKAENEILKREARLKDIELMELKNELSN